MKTTRVELEFRGSDEATAKGGELEWFWDELERKV